MEAGSVLRCPPLGMHIYHSGQVQYVAQTLHAQKADVETRDTTITTKLSILEQ